MASIRDRGNPFIIEYPSQEYFVGRKKQLMQLDDLLKSFSSGKPSNLYIVGKGGVGLTSYLEKIIDESRTRNMLAFKCILEPGNSAEVDIDIIFRALLRELGRVDSNQDALEDIWIESKDSRFQIPLMKEKVLGFEDLLSDFERISIILNNLGIKSCVICIDEAQHIHPLALSLLTQSIRKLSRPGYMIVLSFLNDTDLDDKDFGSKLIRELSHQIGDPEIITFFQNSTVIGPFDTQEEAEDCIIKRLENSEIKFTESSISRIATIMEKIPHKMIMLSHNAYEIAKFSGLKHVDDNVVELALGKLTAIDAKTGNVCGIRNDKTSDEDQLGFNYYIDAFVELIESRRTQLPLTIGLYGSWGMGKSFILDHIEKNIINREVDNTSQESKLHIIKFNAWEYNAAKSIWPGLVRKIMNQMEQELIWGRVDLFKIKLQRKLKRPLKNIIGQLILLLVSIIMVSFILIKYDFNFNEIRDALWGLTLISIITIINGIIDIWLSPLSQKMSSLLNDKKYGEQIEYMEEIRTDLKLLQDRLHNKKIDSIYSIENIASKIAGVSNSSIELGLNSKIAPLDDNPTEDRILVLIDDLDRCEPNKAVEVLQAVNLLLNFEELNFIVFLGIDARIATRAIENYYINLIGKSGASGIEYLEKIIQIPFKIPEPNKEDIDKFIRQQVIEINENSEVKSSFKDEEEKLEKTEAEIPSDANYGQKENDENETINPDKSKSEISKKLVTFERSEIEAFCNLAAYMRPNPRHVKRLMNIYQLVRILARNKRENFILERPLAVITWLLICSQWPLRARKMLEQFDRMDSAKEFNNLNYNKEDILKILYKETNSLPETELKNDRQNHPDFKPNILYSLIYDTDSEVQNYKLTPEDLKIVRRYTINFNPTIEIEFNPIHSRGPPEP